MMPNLLIAATIGLAVWGAGQIGHGVKVIGQKIGHELTHEPAKIAKIGHLFHHPKDEQP